MVNNLYNFSFCSSIAFLRKGYNNFDFIMVKCILCITCFYKYIFFLSFYRYKAKALACTFKHSNKCNIVRLHILSLFRQ